MRGAAVPLCPRQHPQRGTNLGHRPDSARREEATVLVHGAEGTDTTLLVAALAQVILDPSCRTLGGFLGLLEREWIEVRPAVPRG